MLETPESLTPDKRPKERGAIRLFFKDQATGNPVSGVIVSLFADSPGNADSSSSQSRLVATLRTDVAGYVSFKFDRSVVAANARLTVKHAASREDAHAFKAVDLLSAADAHTIHVDASALATVSPLPGLPAVMSPDSVDAVLSPGSIGYVPQLAQARDWCRQLAPTIMGTRRFPAFQIRADICVPKKLACGVEKVEIVYGEILEYEITWYPVGTALGDLLNTITLAPCEQVNIAVIDWMRRETTTLDQTSDVQQQSFQQIDHDRVILESMQSSLKSKSFAWGVAGVAGITKKDDGNSSFAAISGGAGGGKTSQEVALATTNQLSERIVQSASFVASQRNSVVFQTTASEHQTYQTRTIRNHNHCHTVTFMYYQINRNYNVVTEYKGTRDVVLVKYDNKDFDAERAYCNAHLLKDALLDQDLLSCFDELADALFCCDIKPPAPPPPSGSKPLMDSLTLTVKPKEVIAMTPWIRIELYSATGQFPIAQVSAVINPPWQSNGVHTQTFSLPVPIDPTQVAWMAIINYGGGSATPHVVLNEIKLTYHVVNDGDFDFYSSQTQTVINPTLRTPVQPQLPGQLQQPTLPGTNECVENSCCIQKLLGHLNCHKRYYNTILWLNEDPNERVMKWSCCRDSGSEFSLIAQIENEPLTVYGDYLVFPVAGSELVDDPSIVPVGQLVTMPTPGVYAEGILGQCTTCEKIDRDTFWDWKDSPCPDKAPATTGAPAPQQSVFNPSDFKADAISNLINVSTVPGAPPSILKDLVSTLLSNADSGSVEAKAILDKLLDTIKESIKPPPPAKT